MILKNASEKPIYSGLFFQGYGLRDLDFAFAISAAIIYQREEILVELLNPRKSLTGIYSLDSNANFQFLSLAAQFGGVKYFEMILNAPIFVWKSNVHSILLEAFSLSGNGGCAAEYVSVIIQTSFSDNPFSLKRLIKMNSQAPFFSFPPEMIYQIFDVLLDNGNNNDTNISTNTPNYNKNYKHIWKSSLMLAFMFSWNTILEKLLQNREFLNDDDLIDLFRRVQVQFKTDHFQAQFSMLQLILNNLSDNAKLTQIDLEDFMRHFLERQGSIEIFKLVWNDKHFIPTQEFSTLISNLAKNVSHNQVIEFFSS